MEKIFPSGWFSNVPTSGSFYGGTLDAAGNFYTSGLSGFVRMYTPNLAPVNLAGSLNTVGSSDGVGALTGFDDFRGNIAIDALGNIYVVDSENGTIRKGVPFAITNLPLSQAVSAGTSISLTSGFSGQGAYSFQWLFNDVPLSGETNATLSLGPLLRNNTGVYSLLLSNIVTGYTTVINATERALVPPVLSAAQMTASGSFQGMFQDSDGGLPFDLTQVQVQWRSNLPSGLDTNWQTLRTLFTLTNGFEVFTDTNTPNQPGGFYRVLEH